MKKIVLLLFLSGLTLTSAFAVDVTYSTTGVFACSGGGFACAGNTLTGPNGLHITFTGTAQQFPNVSVPPTSYAPFGTFTVSGEINRLTTDTLPANTTFTLDVNQSIPTPGGTEVMHDAVSGTIRVGNSTVTVVFTSGTGDGGVAISSVDPLNAAPAFQFNLSGVDYWIDKSTPLHPETCANQLCTVKNPGTSIINGAINSTVPEPMFYTLSGTGFAGLLIMAIRRRRQAAS